MRPLVILTGPTAVGKTETSIALAKRIGGEIISADSMQVYRGMDIGSAKIKPSEMGGVKHYLIDVLSPEDAFNVTVFQRLCTQAMEEIYAKGKIPILVGGTGFYIQALLYDIHFAENEDSNEIRVRLEDLAKEQGPEALHQMLLQIDPDAAKAIPMQNVKRTIRAIEFYEMTGQKISEHNAQEKQRLSPYCFAYFVLTDDRENLYNRIELRVDQMMEEGLLGEIKSLREKGYHKQMVSMQGIGYKELLDYLDGESTLEEAVAAIKINTRHFAKRQLTWFRREKDVTWVDKQELEYDNERILAFMMEILKNKGIMKE